MDHCCLIKGVCNWYEIIGLYYIKSILTDFSASRQDKGFYKKNKIIRIKFLIRWSMLDTLATFRNLDI